MGPAVHSAPGRLRFGPSAIIGTNIFPVLLFCFTIASTELSAPLILILVRTGTALTYLKGYL